MTTDNYYIESRKKGNKRWQLHVPGDKFRETAERKIAEWRHHGTIDQSREYRVIRRMNKSNLVAVEGLHECSGRLTGEGLAPGEQQDPSPVTRANPKSIRDADRALSEFRRTK